MPPERASRNDSPTERPRTTPAEGPVYLELFPQGMALRVCAIHEASKLEVVFQAPITAGRREIDRLARLKLGYVLRRQRERAEEGGRGRLI